MARQIPLTQGQIALVDDEDYEWLNAFSWYPDTRGNVTYAYRHNYPDPGATRMHRAILAHYGCLIDGLVTDHIDGDGLNNQKANLRLATHLQNAWNSRPNKNSSCAFKGVGKCGGRWSAAIRVNGEIIHLGLFGDPVIAARAYDSAAQYYYGQFAWLNFPDHPPPPFDPQQVLTISGISGFRGVQSTEGGWIVRFVYNGHKVYLGWHRDPERQARLYDAAMHYLYGADAQFNFPHEINPKLLTPTILEKLHAAKYTDAALGHRPGDDGRCAVCGQQVEE